MQSFPVVSRYHFDSIPRTTIQESTVRSFARALLTTNAQVRVDFDASKWWVILIWHPKHTRFDRTVLDACRGTGTSSAAVGSDSENARAFLARGLTVAFGHWPMFIYDVEHLSSGPLRS